MRLRRATTADAPEMTAIEQLVFGVDAWSADSVQVELSGRDRCAVVAVEGDELVGYAITRGSGDVVDLQRIAVRPVHQRQGVAHALLAEVLDSARVDGADRMLLEVSAANRAGVAFYAAEGFVEIDRRARYYRDGSDALVMCRHVRDRPGEGRG